MNKLSVIVLAFNEVNSLKTTVEEIYDLMGNQDVEIIISTSKNATIPCQEMSASLQEKFSNLSLHFQNRPFVAAAVLEVLDTVKSKYVIYMSADKETPASLIPQLLAHIEMHGSDIICASRWIVPGSFTDYGKIKFLLSWLAQNLCKVVYRSSLTEFTYGFRIYRTSLLKEFVFRESKHTFFLESLLIPLRLNAQILEIPVRWVARDEGSSVVNFRTLISYLRPIIRVRLVKSSKLYRTNDKNVRFGD